MNIDEQRCFVKKVRGVVAGLLTFGLLIGLGSANNESEQLGKPNMQPNGNGTSVSLSVADRVAIRDQIDLERRSIQEGPSGLYAWNRAQSWSLRFAETGFSVRKAEESWEWGLKLEAYGFAGQTQPTGPLKGMASEGDRVVYTWSDLLEEWCINGESGLEHGFTLVEQPGVPECPSDPILELRLSTVGDLMPKVSACGRDVTFLDSNCTEQVQYIGLLVFDSLGTTLKAGFQVDANSLILSIDTTGAVYPITVDPIAQMAYVKASNSEAQDQFGTSVAVSGNWVAVGAQGEDGGSAGANGNQLDNSISRSGAVYMFERVGNAWVQQAYLKASNPGPVALFGFSVDLEGDRLIVGAPGEASAATGVDGNQLDTSKFGSGAAYIFERTPAGWIQQAYLKASNTDEGDYFGKVVAISGDTVVVGASDEQSDSTGIDGPQGNVVNSYYGAAYVFHKDAVGWSQQAYVKAINSDWYDRFGSNLDINGDWLAVAAKGERGGGTGLNADPSDNSVVYAGAVYLYKRTGYTWAFHTYMKPERTWQNFFYGEGLSLDQNRLLVGAPGDHYWHEGVNTPWSGTYLDDMGVAYLYERTGSTWALAAVVKPDRLGVYRSEFGTSVALDGGTMAISAGLSRGDAMGVDGIPRGSQDKGGCMYTFQEVGGNWYPQAHIRPSQTGYGVGFGRAIDLDGDLLVNGSPFDTSSAVGINGNPLSQGADLSGAAYILNLNAPVGVVCSPAEPNSTGMPAQLTWVGQLDPSLNDFTLIAHDLPLNNFGYFLNSRGRGEAMQPANSSGFLCLGGSMPIGRHNRFHEIGFSGTSGTIQLTLDLDDVPTPQGTAVVQAGETWFFQAWYRDIDSNFSNTLVVRFE